MPGTESSEERNESLRKAKITLGQLENLLFKSADTLRPSMDASE
jgi:hypothetical protein